MYKLKEHVTSEMLEAVGFEKSDISFGKFTYRADANLSRYVKENKVKTTYVGYIEKVSRYNIEKKETKYYKYRQFILYSLNKRRSYSGHMSGSEEMLNYDITPYIQDLIEKGWVEEI